jgi:WD40 repeat protein
MSDTLAKADRLLTERGVHRQFDAFIVSASFDRSGTAGFALGDGTVRLAKFGDETWLTAPAHDGATLALAADPSGTGFVSGGDDGGFRRIGGDGTASDIARFGMKWVEQVATFRDDKTRLLACSVGKTIHLFDPDGTKRKSVEHPSTVTGIAFDARGKRFGAAHYGGASLWFVASKTDNPRKLEWKGSHTGIVISPDGENVVTSMQEASLHGWRLSDGQHMRMSGYPSKTASMSFSRGGKWLATSGAESVVLWPFTGGGPMGKAPTELAGGDSVTCTFVACHPQHENVAAGFSDGLVVLADISSARILPVCAPGRGPISALAWSDDGTTLALGSETGFAALVDFTQR